MNSVAAQVSDDGVGRIDAAKWQRTGARAGGGVERHISFAAGQRGANAQPSGQAHGEGTMPGISFKGASRGASSLGTASRSPFVYGWRGFESTCLARPDSTVSPA